MVCFALAAGFVLWVNFGLVAKFGGYWVNSWLLGLFLVIALLLGERANLGRFCSFGGVYSCGVCWGLGVRDIYGEGLRGFKCVAFSYF